MDHSKPPCGLLMLRVTNPAHKRLSLSGFLLLRTIFTIQGTHSVFIKFWLECVTNEKDESSFQCCIKDEGRPLIYALREEYINRFMVL
jgi:hypothetical protein